MSDEKSQGMVQEGAKGVSFLARSCFQRGARTGFNDKFIAFTVVFFVLFVLGWVSVSQDDTWRHLALGELFWKWKRFPRVEPWGFLAQDVPFMDLSWASCLGFFGLYQLGGEFGLIGMSAALTALGFALPLLVTDLGAVSPQKGRKVGILFSGVVSASIAEMMMRWRICARPEVFSFLALGVLICLLWGDGVTLRRREPLIVSLVAVTLVIWINFHASVLVGVVLVMGAAWSAIRNKRFLFGVGLILAALLAPMLNPWGWRLVWESVIQGNHPLTHQIFEYMPLPLKAWWSPRLPLTLLFGVCFLRDALKSKIIPGERVALILLVTILSLRHSRFWAYFFLLSLPATARHVLLIWQASLVTVRQRILAGVFGVALFMGAGFHAFATGWGLVYETQPYHRAVDFLALSPFKGRVLNQFGQGGYFMWRLKERVQIFIDNRSPLYLTTSFPIAIHRLDDEHCRFLHQNILFDAMVLDAPSHCERVPAGMARPGAVCDQVHRACFPSRDWALVYWSQQLVYLRRRPQYEQFIQQHEYHHVDPQLLEERNIAAYLDEFRKTKPLEWDALIGELRRSVRMNPLDSPALFWLDEIYHPQEENSAGQKQNAEFLRK